MIMEERILSINELRKKKDADLKEIRREISDRLHWLITTENFNQSKVKTLILNEKRINQVIYERINMDDLLEKRVLSIDEISAIDSKDLSTAFWDIEGKILELLKTKDYNKKKIRIMVKNCKRILPYINNKYVSEKYFENLIKEMK